MKSDEREALLSEAKARLNDEGPEDALLFLRSSGFTMIDVILWYSRVTSLSHSSAKLFVDDCLLTERERDLRDSVFEELARESKDDE